VHLAHAAALDDFHDELKVWRAELEERARGVEPVLSIDAQDLAAVLTQSDTPRERDVPALAQNARLVRNNRRDVLLDCFALEARTPERDRAHFRGAYRVLRGVADLVNRPHFFFLVACFFGAQQKGRTAPQKATKKKTASETAKEPNKQNKKRLLGIFLAFVWGGSWLWTRRLCRSFDTWKYGAWVTPLQAQWGSGMFGPGA
jgi:hypothetical protein